MHLQFLVEDRSGGELVQAIIQKLQLESPTTTFDCKSFHGIGGFTKKNTVKETKSGKLLNDLAIYLRGYNKSFQFFPSAVVIVIDNDDRNTECFRNELNQVAVNNNINIDYLFCIAVEEIEAWLLGDIDAIIKAYPKVKQSCLTSYVQDSICGTWEILADSIYPGGLKRLKKDCPNYTEIGILKSEWAKNIGANMSLSLNKSPSFRYFISEINKRII